MKSSRLARLRFLLLLSMLQVLILTTDTFAQAIGVTGIIINERISGPAPGTTGTVKNTNHYTVADDTGRFTIHAATGDVLLITMTGYVSKEVAFSGSYFKQEGNALGSNFRRTRCG